MTFEDKTPTLEGQTKADLPQPTARTLASRKNGARSRGPRSAAGKARSARNAVTHGLRSRRLVLLDDENAAEFRALASALQAELAPEGVLQADLVGRIVMADLARAPRRQARGGAPRNLSRRRRPRRSRPACHLRDRADPGQLWSARLRDPGPLPRLGSGRALPLARGAQDAPGRGAGTAGTRPCPARGARKETQTNPRRYA